MIIKASLFDDAKLTAICCLAEIFTKSNGVFQESMVKRFYKVYLDCLENDKQDKFHQLINYSSKLFLTVNLPQCTIIQQPLFKKLEFYYQKMDTIYPKKDIQANGFERILRSGTNKICTSLISFLNDEIDLIKRVYDKSSVDIFHSLLDLALQRDRDAYALSKAHQDLEILARSSWNWMIHGIMNHKICQFVGKFQEIWMDKSYPLMNRLFIDICLTMGEFCINQLEKLENSNALPDLLLSGISIIDKMYKLLDLKIKELLNQATQDKEDIIKNVSLILGCTYTWIMILSYLISTSNDPEVEKRKNDAAVNIEKNLQLMMNSMHIEPISQSIRYTITSIFNGIGRFNVSRNIPFVSSIILKDSDSSETYDSIMKKIEEKCIMRLAIGEETIISFYDFEIDSPNEVTTFMIRNMAGSFWWFGELFYKLIHPENDQRDAQNYREPDLTPKGFSEEASFDTQESTNNTMNSTPTCDLNEILERQFEIEEEYEEKGKNVINEIITNITEEAASPLIRDSSCLTFMKKNTVKMFLSNTGILNLKDINNLTHIPYNEKTSELLKLIDAIPDRCQILANLIYCQDPSSDKLDPFPSSDFLYQKFVEDLGFIIEEENLQTGAYQSVKKYVDIYQKILYTSNMIYEVIFTLPNLTQIEKSMEAISQYALINIIWNARTTSPHDQSLPMIINSLKLKDYRCALIITPIEDNYFLLNLLKKDEEFMVFPPVNNFVCSAHMLALIVIQITINFDRELKSCKNSKNYYENVFYNLTQRKACLAQFIKSTKGKDDFQNLLSAFFEGKNTKK